jgi:hypothetical protein
MRRFFEYRSGAYILVREHRKFKNASKLASIVEIGLTATRKRFRYGCFLSDLTGFTADSPAASRNDYGIGPFYLQVQRYGGKYAKILLPALVFCYLRRSVCHA